ncbi:MULTISPECIES: hypothetical protein [unclassified Polaromonas]|jgi:hypothetical protein|nr:MULTISPECIES: hypothetical protein [unclassified Polaromonas]HQR98112.1 hypothetical protein [Polaromonas sp.]HQS38818.1 hypothetical protein [Polaromonas sp.]HQS88072.1 hypothetical protein [Polaromonas sp.]
MNYHAENAVTLVVTALCLLGLYYMSHSWHSLWSLLFLLNLNYVKNKEQP